MNTNESTTLSSVEDDISSDVCKHCHQKNCVFIQTKAFLEEQADILFDQNQTDPLEPNECRKKLYREFVLYHHGHQGRGKRIELPQCVLDGVRKMFPSENAEYMGHRDN